MAGAFGFGPLSPFGGPSDDLLARALAQAASGAPAGFSGPAGMSLPSASDLALVRPRPASFGGLPAPQMPPVAGNPTSEGATVAGSALESAERHSEMQRPRRPLSFGGPPPGAVNVPIPPQRPPEFGEGVSPADVPVQGAVPAMGQAPVGETGGGSMFDGVLGALSRPGVYNTLLGLGSGLLSTPGFGRGIAAGVDYGSKLNRQQAATDLAEAEYGLKRHKLAQEQGAQNQTKAFLIRSGHSAETADGIMAAAAAGDRTALNNALGNAVPKRPDAPAGFTLNPDGSASYIRGGPQDPTTIAAQAGARSIERDEPQLVDVPGPNGTTQKQWVRKGQASGQPVGEVKAPAPLVKEFTGPDGVKRPHALDAGTGQWKPIDLGDGAPAATGNPFATGKFNNDQGKAAGFSDRMFGSERILREMETVNQGAISGALGGVLPNALKSSDRQQLEQAQRDFVNAQLRRESGAAIAKSEFDNAAKQYFPQPGDGDVVVQQKRANRQRAIEAMGREGGPSYRPQTVFDRDGALVPYQPQQQRGMATAPSRSDLEAEARRRGLIR